MSIQQSDYGAVSDVGSRCIGVCWWAGQGQGLDGNGFEEKTWDVIMHLRAKEGDLCIVYSERFLGRSLSIINELRGDMAMPNVAGTTRFGRFIRVCDLCSDTTKRLRSSMCAYRLVLIGSSRCCCKMTLLAM